MDSKQFIKAQRRNAARVAVYINDVAPQMVVQKTLRFIDGNFRAQGWQGATFQKWKPITRKGTILVKTGRLRRSPNSTVGSGWAKIYTNVPYADIHNRGGIISATVNVRGFSRRRFTKGKQTGQHQVKAHTRVMKTHMPQRQFMPYEGHSSPVLENSIKRELEREFKKILNA